MDRKPAFKKNTDKYRSYSSVKQSEKRMREIGQMKLVNDRLLDLHEIYKKNEKLKRNSNNLEIKKDDKSTKVFSASSRIWCDLFLESNDEEKIEKLKCLSAALSTEEKIDFSVVFLSRKTEPSVKNKNSEITDNQIKGEYKVYADAACKGNPGPCGCGVIIDSPVEGEGAREITWYISSKSTNNVGEWFSLILALYEIVQLGIRHVTISLDSQLVVRQINGVWEVRSPHIMRMFTVAKSLLKKIPQWKILHVYR